jgi:hypothetical protein
MSRSSDPLSFVPRSLSPQLRSALSLLLQAYNYAEECERDPWDFAVEMAELKSAGLATADLRWLFCKRYVQHAAEMTRPGAKSRKFGKLGGLTFPGKSCFVLTEAGARIAGAPRVGRVSSTETPYWSDKEHTLFWRGRVVKHFRHEAPNQETVLRTFQATDWHQCVAVCLREDVGVVSSKERLHFTIKNLNRTLRPHLRFRQEGCGGRVRWEALQPGSSHCNANSIST